MTDTKTNQKLSPRRAIVIYHDNGRDNFYLESREIKPFKGKLNLMAPVPLSDNILKAVAKSYMKTSSSQITHGLFIPAHILHGSNSTGSTIVMWHRPSMERSLNFSASLKIKGSKPVIAPATLYLLINNKLYLYALMTNERPDMATKLYNAPYFNIYADGNVCLGTAAIGRVKGKTFEKEAERFERAFYMAEQNGGGGSDSMCKTPLNKLWTGLLKKKAPFPSKKELVQHKKYKTLGDLVNKLIKSNSLHEEEYYEDED